MWRRRWRIGPEGLPRRGQKRVFVIHQTPQAARMRRKPRDQRGVQKAAAFECENAVRRRSSMAGQVERGGCQSCCASHCEVASFTRHCSLLQHQKCCEKLQSCYSNVAICLMLQLIVVFGLCMSMEFKFLSHQGFKERKNDKNLTGPWLRDEPEPKRGSKK